MNKIERLTNEILLLQERGRGSEELARLLEVSKRTILRDIQALCEMGVPIIARDGMYGGYTLAGEYTVQPLQLTWKEMLLLMLALGGLSKMADAPFQAERNSLMSKIQALLPEKHRDRVEGLLEKLSIEVPDRPQRSPMLEALVGLLESGKWLTMSYRSAGPAFKVTGKPLRVYADRGFWYLRALVEGQDRAYRVDRIEEIEETEPLSSSVVEQLPYTDPSHPLVRVCLGPKGIRRVENDQHLYSLVTGLEPPATIEFNCPPHELEWYAKFFGEMGEEAIIDSPPELIERVIERAETLLKIYRKS
jgi:predicted DNA-binding transcriptional regulator YafY